MPSGASATRSLLPICSFTFDLRIVQFEGRRGLNNAPNLHLSLKLESEQVEKIQDNT